MIANFSYVLNRLFLIAFFTLAVAQDASAQSSISEDIRKWQEQMEDNRAIAESLFPIAPLEACGSVLNKYRETVDGVERFKPGFRWSQLSDDEKEKCAGDGKNYIARLQRESAREYLAFHEQNLKVSLEEILVRYERSSVASALVATLNEKGTYLEVGEATEYYQIFNSGVFDQQLHVETREQIRSSVGGILRAEVSNYIAGFDLVPQNDELRSMISELGTITSVSRGDRQVTVSIEVEGSAAVIQVEFYGLPGPSLVTTTQAESTEDLDQYFREFTDVAWVIPSVPAGELEFHLVWEKIDRFNPVFGAGGGKKFVDESRGYSQHLPMCRLLAREVSNNSGNPWSAEVFGDASVRYKATIQTADPFGGRRWVDVDVFKATVPPLAPEGSVETQCNPLRIVRQDSGGLGDCRCFAVSNGIVSDSLFVGAICGKEQCVAECRKNGNQWFADYYSTSSCP